MIRLESDETVGIVGLGRLGMALAVCVRNTHRVVANDRDNRRVAQARTEGFEMLDMGDLARRCSIMFLCVPPEALSSVLDSVAGRMQLAGIVVNLSTSKNAIPGVGTTGPAVVNLKLIGQFKAIEAGIPAVFVMDQADIRHYGRLAGVLMGVGHVCLGDQSLVPWINELATREALLAAGKVTAAFSKASVPMVFIDRAIKNIFAGTLLDYPPDPDNPYTRKIMSQLGPLGDSLDP